MARIKGIAVIDLVRLFRKNKETYYPLLGPEEKAFLAQQILISGWYDDKPYVKLMRLLDRELGNGDLTLLSTLSAATADQVLDGPYKSFKRADGNSKIWWKLVVSVWHLYHDTGKPLVVTEEERERRFRIEGQEDPDQVHCVALTGWLARATEIITGEQWLMKEVACRTDGSDYCEFVMTRFT